MKSHDINRVCYVILRPMTKAKQLIDIYCSLIMQLENLKFNPEDLNKYQLT